MACGKRNREQRQRHISDLLKAPLNPRAYVGANHQTDRGGVDCVALDGARKLKKSVVPTGHDINGDTKKLLEQFGNGEKSPPDPNRKPVISGNGSRFFSAYDPAADIYANLVGTIEWRLSDSTITLAVYPKEAKINGQPVTDKTRIRGHNILNSLVNALENLFQKRVAEYVRELGEANRKEIEETFQIKGLNGIWAGDSDNLTTFNRLYKVGLSKELAARQTFTGKQAFRVFGFSEVKFNKLEPDIEHPSIEERRRLGISVVHCTFYPKGI